MLQPASVKKCHALIEKCATLERGEGKLYYYIKNQTIIYIYVLYLYIASEPWKVEKIVNEE